MPPGSGTRQRMGAESAGREAPPRSAILLRRIMPTTRFTVAILRPETHLYEITMQIHTPGAATLSLQTPRF